MKLYDERDEVGYHFEVYIPENSKDPQEFQLRATKEGELVANIKIPLSHEPRFGFDEEDIARLERKTELLVELLSP